MKLVYKVYEVVCDYPLAYNPTMHLVLPTPFNALEYATMTEASQDIVRLGKPGTSYTVQRLFILEEVL